MKTFFIWKLCTLHSLLGDVFPPDWKPWRSLLPFVTVLPSAQRGAGLDSEFPPRRSLPYSRPNVLCSVGVTHFCIPNRSFHDFPCVHKVPWGTFRRFPFPSLPPPRPSVLCWDGPKSFFFFLTSRPLLQSPFLLQLHFYLLSLQRNSHRRHAKAQGSSSPGGS